MKFGTNGSSVCRNQLALSKIRKPPFPSLQGGVHIPTGGLFELMDRFWWNNLVWNMNGPYVCRNRLKLSKIQNPPFPPLPRGGPCPPTGGLFELKDQFRWNLAQMVFTNVEMKWYCQIYQMVLIYLFIYLLLFYHQSTSGPLGPSGKVPAGERAPTSTGKCF